MCCLNKCITHAGPACLQTDDTARAGNSAYTQVEAKMASRFDGKPPTVLEGGKKVLYSAVEIDFNGARYKILQLDYLNKHKPVVEDRIGKSNFAAQRTRGAYFTSVGRPEFTSGFFCALQTTSLKKAATKPSNLSTQRAKENRDL